MLWHADDHCWIVKTMDRMFVWKAFPEDNPNLNVAESYINVLVAFQLFFGPETAYGREMKAVNVRIVSRG